MKKLAFLLLVATSVCFYSCSKCQDCTRQWTYLVYILKPDGTKTDQQTGQGQTEIFQVCGNKDIKNAEETITTKQSSPSTGADLIVTEGTATCNCK